MITVRSATLPRQFDGRADATRLRLWSLREDVLVEVDPEHDRLLVITRWGETRIDDVGDMVRESLRRMSLGPIALENVLPPENPAGGSTLSSAAGQATESSREWARLGWVLDALSGSVVHTLGLRDGQGPLLSAVPISRNASFRLPDVDQGQPVRLSRFAAMRASNGELLLESPLAGYQVTLHRPLASQVVTALSASTTPREVAATLDVAKGVVSDIVAYLVGAGIVLLGEWKPGMRVARFAEDRDPSLIRWSHHDLLFHSRSRMGRYGGPSGAVFPYADTLPSPPPVKPAPVGRRFELYRPVLSDLTAVDPPLTEVIEATRLCPELSERAVTADQIGELLFRAARIRSISPAMAGGETTYEISDRPYLSNYGLHELELYLGLHRCVGLPKGIFHYDPGAHVLTLINNSEPELNELLDLAKVAAGSTRRPPVLITMTARVARSSWMYGGIAYSMTLTHVGALQQTLCLVATAMGLAPCAPAIDPADAIDTALRLDWPEEIGVGEFFVGYRREQVGHVGLANGDI